MLSLSGARVFLKMESWQPTGSFKVRGAVNVLANLRQDERGKKIVTASAGNHALAVGFAAERLRLEGVKVFVPRTAPRAKVEKLRRFPIKVIETGETYDDAHHAAEEYQRETGSVFVHAYDELRTVAGQGTIGAEILEDLPDVDQILVPVGGGGMISGIAIAVKSVAPDVKIIGVQPEASPALRDSLRDGVVYEKYSAAPTIADGLAGGIGKICFEVAQDLLDDVLVVTEQQLIAAVGEIVTREQLIVEGSGAVGVAALLNDSARFLNQRIVIVLSGANIDPLVLSECIRSSQTQGDSSIETPELRARQERRVTRRKRSATRRGQKAG